MKITFTLIILFTMMTFSLSAQEIRTELISYKDGQTELEGFLAYDPSIEGKLPAVIVTHEWMGINDYTRKRCEQLAKLGYIAFAADVYGKGVRPSTTGEASKEAAKYRGDRALMRQRMNAAFDWIRKYSLTDPEKIAVTGYCFGGTAALELARSGAKLRGVVSFHGGLSNPSPADAAKIQAKVLICHGAVDPHVPKEEVDAFMKEMNDANIDYQFIAYSKAVHAFTNPNAGNDPSRGSAYNKDADARSWKAMQMFFEEIFGKQ